VRVSIDESRGKVKYYNIAGRLDMPHGKRGALRGQREGSSGPRLRWD